MKKLIIYLFLILIISSCSSTKEQSTEQADASSSLQDSLAGYGVNIDTTKLPEPQSSKVDNEGKAIGWPEAVKPKAPDGFTVTKFAGELEHPRWIYIGPNNDIFVVESDDAKKSANRIILFRDSDQDGIPETKKTFLEGLNQPFGMLILNNYFYVANVDGIVRFPYELGQDAIDAEAEKVADLPAGGYNHHWTRNIILSPDSSKIFVSVGSSSNVGEHGMEKEKRRANVLVMNPDGSNEQVYASGLRNPVGIAFYPGTNTLWAAVNERDELGDNLVPDYVTSVKEGGFYGWPYAYFGHNKDPRMADKAPEMVEKSIKPDMAVGAHTSSLGLAFYNKNKFPEKYQGGAFVGQHGSWNRSTLNGYRVLFIPFENAKPAGEPEDFLTGFIADQNDYKVYGRPVCVTVTPDGALLVADDDSGTIWRVAAN
ncbi:sorbosone dehydrogenase family protein [Fulvivirga maritima]|uniref:PQQ-dependent sugar dehydrogenase n=1 Tax=Fulvivirga maritima TaxID=2904247 RepID=UPI001F37DFE9|nr:sorbosone dehydrogenase family protein [Fulvivirga maritima]UII24873.1 sorbosone dehydrogenase family protein [Fulvivirga maritima]